MCLGFELRAIGDDGIEGTDESTVAPMIRIRKLRHISWIRSSGNY